MSVLVVSDLRKRFGAIVVADGLSLKVTAGQVLGVIGPNGAGKTSLFNMIAGDIAPAGGSVLVDGVDVTAMSAPARRKVGLARTFQVPQPFHDLTVFENALVGAAFGRANGGEPKERASAALARMGLDHRLEEPTRRLTLLELKRLEVARALAASPKVLLLDEIAGGLTEREALSVAETVRSVADEGVAIVWIEHVLHALSAVADRAVAVNFGVKVAEGSPGEVLADPEVRRIYMGVAVE